MIYLVDRPTRLLRLLIGLTIVESFVHYADNTLRYEDYTAADPSFLGSLVKQWVIPVSWVLFTAAGLVGYRRFREGRRPEAAAWIGAYSVSGLISVLHYTDIPMSDLSAFQNTFVFLDVALGALLLGFAVWAALHPVRVVRPPTTRGGPMSNEQETAVLAGGCFWGMQDLIRKRPGVISTRVGYTGGENANATYRNHPGHAEAIEIVFDPEQVSFRDLLELFFQIHDPSTMNRQGNDIGTSYRSAIFYTSDEQRKVAEDTIADVDASGLWPGPVVTEVTPAGPFWEAEPEHQDYLERYPNGYTCHFARPDWKLPRRAASTVD
jgi:peptide-methionine (S)-S-oxide reductase